jgi:iron-sulfur cluster repair protein YtfE (RIC family)
LEYHFGDIRARDWGVIELPLDFCCTGNQQEQQRRNRKGSHRAEKCTSYKDMKKNQQTQIKPPRDTGGFIGA